MSNYIKKKYKTIFTPAVTTSIVNYEYTCRTVYDSVYYDTLTNSQIQAFKSTGATVSYFKYYYTSSWRYSKLL